MEKMYYKLVEVSTMTNVPQHTIRYWEKEFPQLRIKTKKGQLRRFTLKEINLILQIRELIINRKFTLLGAKAEIQRISQLMTEKEVDNFCLENKQLPMLTKKQKQQRKENFTSLNLNRTLQNQNSQKNINVEYIRNELQEIKKILIKQPKH